MIKTALCLLLVFSFSSLSVISLAPPSPFHLFYQRVSEPVVSTLTPGFRDDHSWKRTSSAKNARRASELPIANDTTPRLARRGRNLLASLNSPDAASVCGDSSYPIEEEEDADDGRCSLTSWLGDRSLFYLQRVVFCRFLSHTWDCRDCKVSTLTNRAVYFAHLTANMLRVLRTTTFYQNVIRNVHILLRYVWHFVVLSKWLKIPWNNWYINRGPNTCIISDHHFLL